MSWAERCLRRSEHDSEADGVGYFLYDNPDGLGLVSGICPDCEESRDDYEAWLNSPVSGLYRDGDGMLAISLGPGR